MVYCIILIFIIAIICIAIISYKTKKTIKDMNKKTGDMINELNANIDKLTKVDN